MEKKNVALLVVDVQKAYQHFRLPNESGKIFGDTIEKSLWVIGQTLSLFREKKKPIVFVQHTDFMVQENSEGFKLADGLERKETEYQVIKRYPNSFFKTDLAEKLLKEDVGFVIVCGLAAGGCVDATVQGAMENDLGVAVLRHAVAGIKEDYVRVTQEIHPTISVEALKFFLA